MYNKESKNKLIYILYNTCMYILLHLYITPLTPPLSLPLFTTLTYTTIVYNKLLISLSFKSIFFTLSF